jgi:hypothetical protein
MGFLGLETEVLSKLPELPSMFLEVLDAQHV